MEGTRFLFSDQVEGQATGTTAKAGLTVWFNGYQREGSGRWLEGGYGTQ